MSFFFLINNLLSDAFFVNFCWGGGGGERYGEEKDEGDKGN
jgi:hypothetical protein